MTTPLTNIRVFVQWTEQTVFAGEDIECQITFKNIANTSSQSRSLLHPQSANGIAHSDRVDRQRKTPQPQRKSNAAINARGALKTRGHRTTLSLSTPITSNGPPPTTNSWASNDTTTQRSHKRSVSIISMGPSDTTAEDVHDQVSSADEPRGPSKGHGRSASLQIVPRRSGMNGGPPSGKLRLLLGTSLSVST